MGCPVGVAGAGGGETEQTVAEPGRELIGTLREPAERDGVSRTTVHAPQTVQTPRRVLYLDALRRENEIAVRTPGGAKSAAGADRTINLQERILGSLDMPHQM